MRFTPFAFTGGYRTSSITTDGLVFDFQSANYVSGSTQWLSSVGNYTASVTGTVAGGLNIVSASTFNAVGFNGNQWLQFSNNMTASISSSNWQIYAYVSFTNQQTASAAFVPEFFSKGGGTTPSWNFAYAGGTTSLPGYGYIDGGYVGAVSPTGLTTDTLNYYFGTGISFSSTQLFAYSQISGAAPTFTINQYNTPVGNTIYYDANDLYATFTGSAADKLLFGKSVNTSTTNISGSVIRLFAYNRILTSQERKNNWFALSGQYVR
jgi:hypothetical protein